MKGDRRIVLDRTRFLYMAVICLFLAPLFAVIVIAPGLDLLWAERYLGPGLEKEFGFRTERLRITRDDRVHDVFVVSDVTPGGIFERCGVRPMDAPRIYRGVGDFYWALRDASQGQTVTLELRNVQDAPPLRARLVTIKK